MAEEIKTIALPNKAIEISDPSSLVSFAMELRKFIVNEKLFTIIADKKYVEVQGWQFCMLATGVVPVVVDTQDLSGENFIKHQATVELRRLSDDKVIGRGVAICSNKESRKRTFEDYAILSMAQTRAIGKAGRNTYGWLMKIAGYEATPAEEMESVPKEDSDEELNRILLHIQSSETKDDLKMVEDLLPNAMARTLYEAKLKTLTK